MYFILIAGNPSTCVHVCVGEMNLKSIGKQKNDTLGYAVVWLKPKSMP